MLDSRTYQKSGMDASQIRNCFKYKNASKILLKTQSMNPTGISRGKNSLKFSGGSWASAYADL